MKIENNKFEILKKLRNVKHPKKQTWINEALFGFSNIESYVKKIVGGNILEIGCGSGILLNILNEKYNNNYYGIEPFNDGFSETKKILKYTYVDDLNITQSNYENFDTKKRYDLIYCVNVIEHLNNWKFFIDKASNWLTPKGKLIILAPNYGFPYESHFCIPVIFNKKLTYHIFKTHINSFEKENNFTGLWKSLNMIKKKNLLNYIERNKNLKFVDHLDINKQLILRVLFDEEFKKRQKLIGLFSLLLYRLKLINIFNFFPNLYPYMFIEISKKDKIY